MLAPALIPTTTLQEKRSQTPMEIIATSTLIMRTGAETTTLRNSSLEICAAHAMAAPQVDQMQVKMIALAREKEMKVMMEALEVMMKATLMTPQEKENALMTT